MTRQLLTCILFCGTWLAFGQISTPPNGGNQKSVARQYVGSVPFVEITYNSPDVTGPNGQSRKGNIWGGLVPYGFNALGFGASTADNPSPWRAGANENTTITLSHDAEVNGKAIPAGTYGFFVAPAESGPWTLIFSSDNNHWGSFFYTPDNDVLRVDVEAKDHAYTEWLTYEFVDRQPKSTTVALKWEEKMIPFTISFPTSDQIHLKQISGELNNRTGFSYTALIGAANYASGIGAHDEAIRWAEAAISAPFVGQTDFASLSTKARVLQAAGKQNESMSVLDEAIRHPTAQPLQIHGIGRTLIAGGNKEKALEVMKYNHSQNKGAWPTSYGLARAYSAKGDYKQALKYLRVALKNVPEGDTVNPPIIEQNIKKLENGEDIN